jgi:hypothetical protein
VSGEHRSSARPSARRGARLAVSLWKLVLAVWLLPQALLLPVLLLVEVELAAHLQNLPPAPSSLQDGLLILSAATDRVGPELTLAALVGWLLLWPWTVLWHAGLVGWQLEASGRSLRLAELLGLGLRSFWPYLRFSVTALSALGLGLAAVGVSLALGLGRAREAMAEGVMEALLGVALPLALLVLAAGWCATLRGAWLLATDPRRCALRAWWRGLLGSLRSPGPSFGTLALWAIALILLAGAPLLLGVAVPPLRSGTGGAVLSATCRALQAFCTVALFASFAPERARPEVSAPVSSETPEARLFEGLGSS